MGSFCRLDAVFDDGAAEEEEEGGANERDVEIEEEEEDEEEMGMLSFFLVCTTAKRGGTVFEGFGGMNSCITNSNSAFDLSDPNSMPFAMSFLEHGE